MWSSSRRAQWDSWDKLVRRRNQEYSKNPRVTTDIFFVV